MTTTEDVMALWAEVQAEKANKKLPPATPSRRPSPVVEELDGAAADTTPPWSAAARPVVVETVASVLLLASGQVLDDVAEWIVSELEALP